MYIDRTHLPTAAVGQMMSIEIDLCRSITYDWLGLVTQLESFYTRAIVGCAHHTISREPINSLHPIESA